MACDDLITNQDLENAKKDATTMSDFVESDSPEIQSKNGKNIRTLQGINDAADNLISSLGGTDIGDYKDDLTLNSYNEYVVFDRAGSTTGPSLWKAIPPRTPTPGTPLPYTIDSAANPDPTSDSNIEPFSDINKDGAELIAQEEANAGDSQLAGGNIWPLSSQDSLSFGAQSSDVPLGVDRLRVFTGSQVEVLYLWEPSGEFSSSTQTITDISVNTLGGYDVVTNIQTYEFVILNNLNERNKNRVTGWGAVADETDQTSQIVAYVSTLDADYIGEVVIPSLVVYQINPVMEAAPPGAVVIDEVGSHTIFGNYKPQFRGTYQKGTGDGNNDIVSFAHSGHNTGFMYSNDGSSGSASGSIRAMQTSYSFGFDETSFPRTAGKIEFQDFNDNRWAWGLRSNTPFEARDYFNWGQGITTAINDTCLNGGNFYVAASAGTTGTTPPTHTSGTVSDGGVDWTYIPFLRDRTIWKVNEIGQVFLGGYKPGTDVLYQQYPLSPNAAFIFNYSAIGDGKAILFTFDGTDGGGSPFNVPNIRCDQNGYRWQKKTGGTELLKINDNGLNVTHNLIKRSVNATDNDTTPSVDGVSTLVITNSNPTTITSLDDGTLDQEVDLVFLNGNTTLQHGGNLILEGGVDVTPSTFSLITVRRVTGTSAWLEKTRSIK